MEQPTPDEIAEFLGAYERLAKFEAMQRMARGHGALQRMVRGHGAFEAKELPIDACVKTIKWLYELAELDIPDWVKRA